MNSNSAPEDALDEQTMKLGLLMEAAQAHQKLAEASLKKLRLTSQDIAGQIRADVQQQLVAGLHALTIDARHACDALRAMRRIANLRLAVWSVALTTLCSLIPVGIACWLLPSPGQIATLRAQYMALRSNLATLEQRGARMELRDCGESKRLCVRVDRSAPPYGEKADYLVVKGY
ncbi:MAG: hypothetical protein JOZ12_12300 [Sinobacteraceae bacterium]|nr:hypothetical protein [Nevskiaceae bacterium]